MESIESKHRRSERAKIAREIEKLPIGEFSLPTTATPFEVAFTVRAKAVAAIKEGGK